MDKNNRQAVTKKDIQRQMDRMEIPFFPVAPNTVDLNGLFGKDSIIQETLVVGWFLNPSSTFI